MEHFHFTTPPFTRELKLEHRFKGTHIEEEISAIKRVIESRQSACLVAPAGTGKTVAIRALLGTLPEARYQTTYLKLTDISARDMCRQIAAALGVAPAGHYPSLVNAIEKQLRQGFSEQGKRQVIVFDEAHDMRHEFLRMLRIITNFDMDSKLVVSLILCGQPSLKQTLLTAPMEDIRQRLVYYAELRLLTREETRAYVEHRCKIAGSSKNPFATDAVEALFEVTRGNLRAIDKLATASLFATSQAGRDTVDSSDVASVRASQWM